MCIINFDFIKKIYVFLIWRSRAMRIVSILSACGRCSSFQFDFPFSHSYYSLCSLIPSIGNIRFESILCVCISRRCCCRRYSYSILAQSNPHINSYIRFECNAWAQSLSIVSDIERLDDVFPLLHFIHILDGALESLHPSIYLSSHSLILRFFWVELELLEEGPVWFYRYLKQLCVCVVY